MSSKIKLSLLACALGAASIATAQTTNDISAPTDALGLPGSVASPTLPVVVSPPDDIGRGTATRGMNGTSRQALPLVRSIGRDSSASGDDTGMDGAVTGALGSTKVDGTATVPGIAADMDASADANSGAGDTGNIVDKQNNEQNNQPGKVTTVPAARPGVPRTDAGASDASASGT